MQPHAELANQFVTLFTAVGRMYDRKGVLSTLLEWLSSHKDYAPSFWTFQDEEGNHPFMALAQKSDIALDMYDEWKQLCSDVSVVNQPNIQGEVLLHEFWKRLKSDKVSYLKDKVLQKVEDLQTLTDPVHWTWLDKANDQPGFGWAAEVLKLTSEHSSSNNPLVNINNLIAQKFPQKMDPKAWLTIDNPSQVVSFQNMGMSLRDMVPVTPEVSMPAWQWITCIQSYRRNHLRQQLIDGKFGEVDVEEIKAFASPSEKMSYLIPRDHRAKSGYVKSVLGCRSQNTSGISSLGYLIRHRTDLLPMFVQMSASLPKDDLVPLFVPDKAQVPFALRVLLQHPSAYKDLEKLALMKGLDFDPQLEKGWALKEREVGFWLRNTSDQQVSVKPSYLVERFDVHVLFGQEDDQLRLSQLWDKKLVSFAKSLGKKNTSGQILHTMSRELMVYLLLKPEQQDQLIAPLRAQMDMMLNLLARNYSAFNAFVSNVQYGQHVPMPSELPPPSVFTQGMADVLEHVPEFAKDHNKFGSKNEEWHVAYEKHVLTQSVGGLEQASSAPRRMKL